MTCTTAVNNFFFCRSKLWKTKNTFCYFDLEDEETGTLRKNFGRHDVPALYPYSRTNDASTNGTDLYWHFSYFFHKIVCCGYSLKMPWQGASNEYPQHMFLCRFTWYPLLSRPMLSVVCFMLSIALYGAALGDKGKDWVLVKPGWISSTVLVLTIPRWYFSYSTSSFLGQLFTIIVYKCQNFHR